MIEDGLSYPARGEWAKRTIIGGVLLLFAWLILPALIFMGYIVNVLRTTADGDEEPPAFEDWGKLLVDGLLAMVIALVYAIVPVVLYMIVSAVLVGGSAAIGGDGGGFLAGLLSMLLFLPVLLAIYYVVPAALTNFAKEGSIGAAFDFGALKPVVLSVDYLVAVLFPLVIAVITYIVTFVLAITFIGLILVPFVQFYGNVAIMRMFGVAYANRTGDSARATNQPSAPA
ncbi:DUF4013 domain-containing protein [Natronobiforma cellulositropha]|uniref:DUF4013 domain-containing protein n=1 Tax=Natronobiforma cellulositropha TaxID=1679076 RepID=UPI0021D60DE9|nr:DUF4013 domain-containing protein [Natronobiforma cellulositropha]